MTSTPHPSAAPTGPLARVTLGAARTAGRFPKTMILLWLAIVVGCLVAGNLTGTRSLSDTQSTVGQSRHAENLLDANHLQDPTRETFMVRAGSAADAGATAAGLAHRLRALREVASIQTPLHRADHGRALLVIVALRGHKDSPQDLYAPLVRQVTATRSAHPGSTIVSAGDASFAKAFTDDLSHDLGRAGLISLPITLVILAIAFGALAAACVPLLLGITAVAGAFGALGLVSEIVPQSSSTPTVVGLIGLAVGIDYSLFYIRREREERRAGAGAHAALHAAGATVGRAVAMAGLTVMLSVAGLLLTGMAVFQSMALGTIVVAILAVIGSLTVLPAVLALLGDRVNAGRFRRVGRGPGHSRVWGAIARGVTRRPLASLITACALLGALAVPALHMRTASPDLGDLPTGTAVVHADHAIEQTFGSTPEDSQVVVSGRGLDSAGGSARLALLGRTAVRATRADGTATVAVSADGTTARIDVPMPAGSTSVQRAAVKRLRAAVLPAARDTVVAGTALSAFVSGHEAASDDFTAQLRRTTPIVIGVVLGVAMLLLFAAFGSLPLALGVMVLNLLSIGAAYGLITAVFQDHWHLAERVLHFTSTGAITDWLPLFAFVVLFGLSMDYTILVLERVREARAAGRSARDAATEGVAATGGVVTSAALVMVAVFLPYASGHVLELKELGVGVAFAILIDATIVRGMALPALIAALGDRRWRVPVTAQRTERWDDEPRGQPAVPIAHGV